jgi:hypothetical protein
MDHFSERLKERVGITLTRKQRYDIIQKIQGNIKGFAKYVGCADTKERQWWQVESKGILYFVLYDSHKNKKCLLTCLNNNTKPIETLWDARARLLEEKYFHEREIIRIEKSIESMSKEIDKQETLRA